MGFSRQGYWSGLPFPSPKAPMLLNKIEMIIYLCAVWNHLCLWSSLWRRILKNGQVLALSLESLSIAFLHHAMGFGLWISTSYSGRYTNLLLTHLQSVCLSAEHPAQFLFDKYIVKDPKTKPCTLYKNKDGKKGVGFLGGILKLKYPVRVWGFLWHNVWCRASLVAHTIKNLSAM